MAKKSVNVSKCLAKLADKKAPCAFCSREVDDETIYGKLYSIGDIHVHYFCVLLSCCLIQKGKDVEGLFGFMYLDILAEIERSKKHRCSYCNIEGATLGCSIVQCKKQFHLPCGRERNAVSLFYGNYKTFCEKHAPKQKIPAGIMTNAKSRLKMKKINNTSNPKHDDGKESDILESVCVICYEEVDGFPTTQTFWPPCCGKDAWFHRSCLQRLSLSAGVHYLKCPLCNDKEIFSTAVHNQGYYIPDRDAAWELEQNAFSEIYERPVECRAEDCQCPRGRDYDAEMWDIKLCVLCGSPGAHSACHMSEYFVCAVCEPAAPPPADLAAIDAVSLPSQNRTPERVQSGPVMPSRMSLRRTKPKPTLYSSSSSQNEKKTENMNGVKSNTDISREDLNLKTPKRPGDPSTGSFQPIEYKIIDNDILSPIKLLKKGLNEKVSTIEVENIINSKILEEMREKFKKPKPLSVKRKIVEDILEGLIEFVKNESVVSQEVDQKSEKESIQSWQESPLEESKETLNTTLIKTEMSISDEDLSSHHISKTQELLNINENTNWSPNKGEIDTEDDSSSSTFQLPPEFVAESSNSLPIIDTPKKLKKINIEKDSMEISENNQKVNIDLVKVENNESLKDFKSLDSKCAFKLSPLNKDILEKNVDIDMESFKSQYLNEVDRKFIKTTETLSTPINMGTAIDFEMGAKKRPRKRKLTSSDNVSSKKRKTTKMVKNEKRCNKNYSNKRRDKKRKYKKKHNTELSIRNRNVNLKIRLKLNEFNLQITKPKKRNRKNKAIVPKILKQYVLQFPTMQTSLKDYIARPDTDVTPPKKKHVKLEVSADNFKQTSIESFFKKSPKP